MMTLHEAMVLVLEEMGDLKAADLAAEIHRRGLYSRGDRQPLPGRQVSARANNHPELFCRRDGRIGLSRSGAAARPIAAKAVTARPVTPQQAPATTQPPPVTCESTPVEVDIAPAELMYTDLGTVGELVQQGLPKLDWLNKCGIYRITAPYGYRADFISAEQATAAGNVLRPWSVEALQAKWVAQTDVLYMGLAGRREPRSLRKRLGDLLRHARGKTSSNGPHKGGEIIWQLSGYEQFRISAAPTAPPPAPRDIEFALLREFVSKYGKLPFANRQG